MRYKVVSVGEELARIYTGQTMSPDGAVFVIAEEVVTVPGREDDTDLLVFVEYSAVPGAAPTDTGWMETRFLEEIGDEPRPPVDEKLFVQECVFAEMAVNATDASAAVQTDGEAAPARFPVSADYLIAWALVETKMGNPPPDPDAGNADGPFRLTDAQWQAYLSSGVADQGVTAYYRTRPNLTVYAAAYISQIQMAALSQLLTDPDLVDGPYVPSFLNVYHSQVLGSPDAAAKIQKLKYSDRGDTPIDAALSEFFADADALQAFMQRRKPWFFDGSAVGTVDRFILMTGNDLDAALDKAFTLIKTHMKGILADDPPFNSDAPWMKTAEEELRFWRKNDDDDTTNVNETDPDGRMKVQSYFDVTGSGITTNEPWCGAFVAYCLHSAGEPYRSSIVAGSVRAANWLKWGNTSLFVGSRHKEAKIGNIPLGAVVVLWSSDPKRSGHVGFFAGFDGDQIVMLGGNQSDRVSKMHVKRREVRAIRWHNSVDPAADATDTTPANGSGQPGGVNGATNRDVLVLARTIYGEARGELASYGRKSLQAVANVVINRARTGYRGSSVADVCLKPWQFSCWNAKDPNRAKIIGLTLQSGNADFRACFEVAEQVIAGDLGDITDGARHYHSISVHPAWANDPHGSITARIGRHIFYKGVR